MLSGLTSVAFSCARCWGHWSQSHRRITLALHLTHSLLHLQRRRKEREESEDGEWKEGGREREESEDGEWKEGGRGRRVRMESGRKEEERGRRVRMESGRKEEERGKSKDGERKGRRKVQ